MFFFENYNIQTVSVLVLMLVVLIFLNEITRRNKWVAIGAYIVLPIVLSIFLWPKTAGAGTAGGYWFAWVKTFSALAGVIGFMVIRYVKKVGDNKYAVLFPVAILVVNIIEAIFRDLEVYKMNGVFENGILLQGGPWNIINAIAGVFLVLSLTGWVGIKVANTKSQDMIWPDQLWFWIIAYDLWNVAYCYNCISNRAMYAGVLIIVACTVAEKFKRGAWLQHRAMTLALWGMFSLSVNYAASPMFAITSTHNPSALMTLSILALIANVGVFAYEIYTISKTKRNPLKQEIYTHLGSYKKNLSENGLKPGIRLVKKPGIKKGGAYGKI